MVKKSMVEELITDGAKLLEALDRDGFPVEAMFWIDEPEDDRSRLVIASPLVVEKGSTVGYRRIREMLPGLKLAGLEMDDIYLAEPDSRRFQSMLSFAENSPKIIAGPSWFRKADAVVYRWPDGLLRGRLAPPHSVEELRQAWDFDWNLGNNPSLLIGGGNGEFVLRFHPKHGRRKPAEFDGIKKAFLIAVHRQWPQCQIDWLVQVSSQRTD